MLQIWTELSSVMIIATVAAVAFFALRPAPRTAGRQDDDAGGDYSGRGASNRR